MAHVMEWDSPIGRLTIASDGERITGLWMCDQKYFGLGLDGGARPESVPVFERARAWLDRYFQGERPQMDLPLAPCGSAFRQSVWRALRAIPIGEVTTYGAIAKELGINSAQAVGGAVAHNPISILIPCHRVVGADGSLTGYAGGVDRKIKLLALEGVRMDGLFVPTKGTAL